MGMTANKLPQIIVSFARLEKANLEPIWQDEIGRLRSVDPVQSETFDDPFRRPRVIRSRTAANVLSRRSERERDAKSRSFCQGLCTGPASLTACDEEEQATDGVHHPVLVR